MRKLDPNAVVDDFAAQIDSIKEYYSRVSNVLVGSQAQKADQSTLSEQSFVTIATAFEGFLSDLFYSYINRDPEKFLDDYEYRILDSVGTRFGAWHAAQLSYKKQKHVKVGELQEIIDPSGWNITFKDFDSIKQKGQAWLVGDHRNRVRSLTDHDGVLIETVKAIRDYIAHRSSGSKQRMNEALAKVDQGPPNENLGRGQREISNIGSFLKADVDGATRFVVYCDRLMAIANTLRI